MMLAETPTVLHGMSLSSVLSMTTRVTAPVPALGDQDPHLVVHQTPATEVDGILSEILRKSMVESIDGTVALGHREQAFATDDELDRRFRTRHEFAKGVVTPLHENPETLDLEVGGDRPQEPPGEQLETRPAPS